jgi:hypothetical protein
VDAQIERRLWLLGLDSGGPRTVSGPCLAPRLARALRRERRAARAGAPGYDPVRHLVLARLERMVRKRRR